MPPGESQCDDSLLQQLVNDELDERGRLAAEQHLTTCSRCAEHTSKMAVSTWGWDEVTELLSADQYDGAISGNGNDVYELHNGLETVDIFGEVGVDGSGTVWDYEDSIVQRVLTVTVATPVFNASEWTFQSSASAANPGSR